VLGSPLCSRTLSVARRAQGNDVRRLPGDATRLELTRKSGDDSPSLGDGRLTDTQSQRGFDGIQFG
jgi:hypothetical protein